MIKFGIKARLTAGIISAVGVITLVLVGYYSLHDLNADKGNAVETMRISSDKITSEISRRLSIGLGRTRSLTNILKSIQDKDSIAQDAIIDPFLYDAMKADTNYLAFWISFELKYILPRQPDQSGRKTWLVDRMSGQLKKRFEWRGVYGIKESEQYLTIRRTKTEALVDPYWYDPRTFRVNVDSILVATIAVPVIDSLRGNLVVGLAGIDFNLRQFNKFIRETDSSLNYRTYLISNNGTIVVAPETSLTGKDFKAITDFPINSLGKFDVMSKDTTLDHGEFKSAEGLVYSYHLNTVKIGKSDKNWYLCIVASNRELLKDAKRTFIKSVFIGLAGIILMIILIYFISNPLVRPITETTRVLDTLSQGKIDEGNKLEDHDRHELGIMAGSVNRIRERFRAIAGFAEDIGQGKLDTVYPYNTKDDILGQSLEQMQADLIKFHEETAKKDWVKTGIAGLNDELRGAVDLESLAKYCIQYIAQYLSLPVGALYYADETNKVLRLGAGYAISKGKDPFGFIKYGDGLAGECAVGRKPIILAKIPQDYFAIKSATGSTTPTGLVVIPCIYNKILFAVLELGKLSGFSANELELLNSFSDNIAITVQTVKAKDDMSALLAKTLEQKEELQAQEEELREANQEQEKNAQLLEEQSEKISEKNRSLEIASKEIEEKAKDLEQASRYKSEFLANMSHELRTPLNSMLILSQSLAQNHSGNLGSDEVESAQIIYKSGNDLHDLINEILDLSKIEAGKMSINIETIEVRQIQENISSLYRATVASKGLSWTVSIEPGCPANLNTDQQRTEQIIKNLVSNAIKFTSKGGISVTFKKAPKDLPLNNPSLKKEQYIAIMVADTGIGIPREKQQAIFEAFQQADGSISRKFGGTGLGLSISKELAKLLNGEIHISSTPGQGSVFTLILPSTGSEDLQNKQQSGPAPAEVATPDYENLSAPVYVNDVPIEDAAMFISDDRANLSSEIELILIIEDDPDFAKILLKECHKQHFKCIIAGDGETGYQLAKKYLPAAVILDIKLPGIDGWKVLDLIKHDPQIRHIPVHMMSSMDETIEAYQKGAIGYLKKPVNAESLSGAFEKIDHFLEKKMKHLLIVEDNELMQKTIRHLLKGSDIVISEVSTALECIEILKKEVFDCIILDLGLPDKNGLEVISEIREMHLDPTPPIIVYTGQELTKDQNDELNKYTKSIIIKGVRSEERLLDEATLFLHRVVEDLPQQQQTILKKLYEKEDTFEGRKVLLVDDDMRNIFALAKVFEEKGISVLKAANGLKALEMLESNIDTDAILMDIMMPEMDGFECIQRIRKDPRFKNTPIIAVTAKAMKEDRQKCMDAGASDYVSKPIDINKLLSILRVWLKK
jgi:CheY-like chemotaxis protein/signal transduction histidine kinase/HAMP domain-containing protein